MVKKELRGKDVRILIDASALSCCEGGGASQSIWAKGCLAEKQPLLESMLIFKSLVLCMRYEYFMGAKDFSRVVKLEEVSVSKKHIIVIGLEKEE